MKDTNLTRRGVCKNLENSPYTFTTLICGDKIDLCFSSRLHLENFKTLREQNYSMLYNYLYKRFKYRIDCRMLSDCNLYSKIENRGFCIKVNNRIYRCKDNLTLSGGYKMKKSLGEWQETLTTSSGEK